MLKQRARAQSLVALVALAAFWLVPLSALAQTQIKYHKNKYTVQQDVQLGREAAQQAEKEFPILNDRDSTAYLQEVGRRLVNAIPPQFQHSEFSYFFKIVDASDINAFALPGGPMYVNRGMIERSESEGELAGVMAHELAHVALRHGTAQATKGSSAGGILAQVGQIGAIIGGGIIAGEAGAQLGGQLGALGAAAYLTKFSREYETEADVLGSQMMARAGYDPEDLAQVFQSIAKEGGNQGPGFLSSHPNPTDRLQRIRAERQQLEVSRNPIRETAALTRTQQRLRGYPPARTMEQIARAGAGGSNNGNNGGNTTNTSSGGTYNRTVTRPSTRYRTDENNVFSVSVPDNWETLGGGQNSVSYAPNGAFGDNGITHGIMIGLSNAQSRDLAQASDEYVRGVLQGNSYLRAQGNAVRGTLSGRTALGYQLAGTSPVTGKTEVVTVYTTQMRDGSLFSLITVVPQTDARLYTSAFSSIRRSLQLHD